MPETTSIEHDRTAPELICLPLELADPDAPTEDTEGAQTIRALVRLHHVPLGFMIMSAAEYRSPDVLERAGAEFAAAVTEHLRVDTGLLAQRGEPTSPQRARVVGCPRSQRADPITVVVCTRDRPGHLRACLAELTRLQYERFEVVVVDNASSSSAPREVFDELVGHDPRFRYVGEPQPGLSVARNAGWRDARHDLVAFTDDDVRIDPFWLTAVVTAFGADSSVECVTGLVATRVISGPQQRYFDARVSWSDHLTPQTWGPVSEDPLHPWAAGRFGAGANMALRRSTLVQLGGFDEHLGAGSLTRGGEDLDMFARVLLAGGRLRYEPASIVWHIHRSTPEALQSQLLGYGIGLTAYLTKHALRPRDAVKMFARLPLAVRHVLRVTEGASHGGPVTDQDRRFRRLELRGMVLGPIYYLRSRLRGAERSRRMR